MCDTLSAIAAVGSLVSGGAGIYEANKASDALAATQNAQNAANSQWIAYQTGIHQQQVAAEDAARQKATQAQQSTLAKVGPQAQTQTQTAEQQRLNNLYTQPGTGGGQDLSNSANLLLSGQDSNNKNFMTNLTEQVNNATTQARQRIQALATANSYGGSFGGLGTTVPFSFMQGGNDINSLNAIRQGNLRTYGVEQQVQPIQYAVGPGVANAQKLSTSLTGIAGTLAGFAGTRALGAGGLNLFGGGGGGVSYDPAGNIIPPFNAGPWGPTPAAATWMAGNTADAANNTWDTRF